MRTSQGPGGREDNNNNKSWADRSAAWSFPGTQESPSLLYACTFFGPYCTVSATPKPKLFHDGFCQSVFARVDTGFALHISLRGVFSSSYLILPVCTPALQNGEHPQRVPLRNLHHGLRESCTATTENSEEVQTTFRQREQGLVYGLNIDILIDTIGYISRWKSQTQTQRRRHRN